jgi:hypothetical protein
MFLSSNAGNVAMWEPEVHTGQEAVLQVGLFTCLRKITEDEKMPRHSSDDTSTLPVKKQLG